MAAKAEITMQILLIGKTGQLGWELQRTLPCLGELTAVDYPDIDLTQPESVRALVRRVKPSVIVNAAAYTAVDRAETDGAKCHAINALAPAILAEEALACHAVLIHYSTDYVFDGEKGGLYTEMDEPHPLNAYGSTKWAGEQAISQVGGAAWIFRTSWVYSLRRDSFVSKVLEWGHRQKSLRIVSDQVGGPTWCRMLAEISTQALVQGQTDPLNWALQTAGTYHLAGSGSTSRFEWAKAILDLDPHKTEQVVTQLLPALTAEFPTPARRPLYTPLDCSKFERTFRLHLPPWQTSLRLLMEA
jgi:dTDP-4-dehydrorhamnose reductase